MEIPNTLPGRTDLRRIVDNADGVKRVWGFHLARTPRLAIAILVLAAFVSCFAVLSATCYCLGRGVSPDYCFFDPNRAPTRDEANIAILFNYALQSDEKNTAIFVGDSTCTASVDPGDRLCGPECGTDVDQPAPRSGSRLRSLLGCTGGMTA